MRSILSILALATLFAIPCAALDPDKTLTQYAHRIWGQEEGLFQPTIYSILQTRDGFLWLGTQDSLIRFDGVRFREFEDGNAAVFHRSIIRSLAEDGQGNLWVGSIGSGIAKIDSNGKVTRYTTRQGLPSDNIFCVAPGSGGDIWACTDQGLARLTNGHVQVWNTANGLPSNEIRSTCESPDGTRWVAGVDFGLGRWTGARFESYANAGVPSRENVTALVCASNGSIWVGKSSGVSEFRGTSFRSFSTRDGLPDNEVSSLTEGRDGSIWIGTNDGISRFNKGEISVYKTRDGLSHSLVLSLYMDREGTLWAGTKDGLDQFTDGNLTPYTTNEGLVSNDVGPLLEDRDGHLWAGTLGEGLQSFDGHRFRTVAAPDGLLNATILSLALDPNGDLWIGTMRDISRMRNGKVVATYTPAEGLSGSRVHALFVDGEGTLWAGTNGGLDRFNGSRFAPANLFGKPDHNDVISLAGGRSVRLFVSTDGPGFYYLKGQTPDRYPLDVLHSVDCYYLNHDRHTMWMGTLGSGLVRWKNGTISHIRIKDGLYDNRIYSILEDDSANLWLASSKGIFRVSEKELEDFADGKTQSVVSIPFSTGQLRFECRSNVQPAACRTRDGRLWFSTTSGLVVIDPKHLLKNRIPPPARITSIIVNGERADLRQNLRLQPPLEKNLEIRYSGLSFISPEKVTFKYKLDGFDKDWTDAGTRREAFFTNLPPGNFRFVVVARNADGVWSRQAASLNFTIEPRLYQRLWFFPSIAALFGMLAIAAYRMRIRHLRERFNLVLAERSRIARELHDTLLQGLSGLTMQLQALWTKLPASKERNVLAEIIKDAGRCSTEARHSLWGLRTAGPRSLNFSEKLDNLSRQAVSGKPIELKLALQPVVLNDLPEAEYQLLRIAQEAISNTLEHARATTLQIQLCSDKDKLQLVLEDDGIGFVEDSEEARFGHFGLVGMRERAQEIGAQLSIGSVQGQGTKIAVSLPLRRTGAWESNPEGAEEHQYR